MEFLNSAGRSEVHTPGDCPPTLRSGSTSFNADVSRDRRAADERVPLLADAFFDLCSVDALRGTAARQVREGGASVGVAQPCPQMLAFPSKR